MSDRSDAMRVGIIGAGQISEFHMRALSRVPGTRVVGVVDADRGRAEALCRKWGVERPLTDVQELFAECVDVVHILTPPSSHASLTLQALKNGAHVYVEKPLATDPADSNRIVAAARDSGRVVCVGHSFLRDPILMHVRRIVDSGEIGEPLSVQYVRTTVYPQYCGGTVPEMYRAGGYPFRDMGVHGLYIIESFLGEIIDASPKISSTGRDPMLHCDEWTVALGCQRGQASIYLSWSGRPQQHTVTITGTRGVLRADLYAMCVSVKRSRQIPEHVSRIVNSVVESSQIATGTLKGLAGFALGRVRQYHGLQQLVEDFYSCLREGRPSPVAPEQARSIVAFTEAIANDGDRIKKQYLTAVFSDPHAQTLVTGGTGLIGRRLVQRLLEKGRRIRLLVRRIPADPFLADNPNIELIIGDLGDPDAVERAVASTSSIFHLGAALKGTVEEYNRGTIVGTRNVVEAALRHKVAQFVHVSSLSVLHALAGDEGAVISEDWPLEPHAEWRGQYSRTKLVAENLVREAVCERRLPAVILRPAEVLGVAGPRLTAGIALQFGRLIAVLGNGNTGVPMVFVEDLVDALVSAEQRNITDGSVIHIVDPACVTQNDLLQWILAQRSHAPRVVYVPLWVVRLVGSVGDILGRLTKRRLPISSYRLNSGIAARRFESRLAEQILEWRPRIGILKALDRHRSPAAQPTNDKAAPTGPTIVRDGVQQAQ